MKQKTMKPKFFDKLKVGAAAFALALPLCGGCAKQTTIPPASQPSGYTEMKRTEPKRMAMGIASFDKNKKPATTQPASGPTASDLVDRAVADAYKKAATSQPALHEAGKKQPDIGFASSRWVTAGMKLATKDYVITVLELTKYGIILLAESPGHRIMFQVPYGQKFIDAPEVGVFRAEKGGQSNTAKLEIE